MSSFEYTIQRQPKDLEMYLKKLDEMHKRTLIKYHSRWESLVSSKYVDSNAVDLATKLESLIKNVLAATKAQKIKPTTFRQYKAAICYGLASVMVMLQQEKIPAIELDYGLNQALLEYLYKTLNSNDINFASMDYGLYEDRTSALKKKSFPQRFYDFLICKPKDQDLKKNNRYLLMQSFVEANLLVGLRPIEWLNVAITSDIETKNIVLFVANAKNSLGRANGDIRELNLIGLSDEDKIKILNFYVKFQNKLTNTVALLKMNQEKYLKVIDINEIKNSSALNFILENFEPTELNIPRDDLYDKYENPKNGVAEIVLRSMQNELFRAFNDFKRTTQEQSKHRVTLYSTRHQCVANAKSSNTNVFEIAAFFGHSSIETNSRHYGKAWSGWSKFDYKPSLESIKEVKGSEHYLKETYNYDPKVESINVPILNQPKDQTSDFDLKFI